MVIDTSESKPLAIAIGRRKEATAIVQIYNVGTNEKSAILINNCLAEVFLQFNAAYLNALNLPYSTPIVFQCLTSGARTLLFATSKLKSFA